VWDHLKKAIMMESKHAKSITYNIKRSYLKTEKHLKYATTNESNHDILYDLNVILTTCYLFKRNLSLNSTRNSCYQRKSKIDK